MKKNYLLGMFALAAMTMVGCSNDEVVNDYSQDNAIQFGTYVGRDASSRAHFIVKKVLAEKGFGVFAYYHPGTEDGQAGVFSENSEPNFMYNQWVRGEEIKEGTTITYSSDNWTYSPVKYWPNNDNDRVSFFAYAPWQQTTINEKTGFPIITFAVNGNVEDQQDLLWAAPRMNLEKQTIGENVLFEFKHALSRIGFEVQTMIDKVNPDGVDDDIDDNGEDDDKGNGKHLDANTTVVVKKVTLTGKFITTGTLKWEKDENNDGYTASIGGDASANDITYTLAPENFENSETHNLGAKESSKYKVTGQSVDRVESKLNNDESYIMIIPKKFGDNDKLTIAVEYDVVTKDENLELGYSAVTNTISSKFDNIEFKAGHAYKFSLHLGLTTVKLAASVDQWDNGNDWAVNLPLNVETTSTNPTTPGQGGDATDNE